jgi:hypothetical protein
VRAFRVKLPSAERYWTIVDDEYRIVGDVDEYLRHLRFGQDVAESTTKALRGVAGAVSALVHANRARLADCGRTARDVRHLA